MLTSASLPLVVLDANVLFPASLRDLLLRCAEHGMYRLRISQQIWDEVARNLIATGPMTSEQVARLDNAIQAFLTRIDAHVTGYEHLVPTLTNDPEDRHVLAVAIQARAYTLVTFNLKHYPATALTEHGIIAVHPDTFLTDLHGTYPEILARIVREQAAELKNPPLSVTDVLDALAQHVPTLVGLLRPSLVAQ